MAIEIIAIITPAPGKFDRAMEVLSTCAEGVKNNEPTAMKYKPYKSKNAEGQDVIVMLEAYGYIHRLKRAYLQVIGMVGLLISRRIERQIIIRLPLALLRVRDCWRSRWR